MVCKACFEVGIKLGALFHQFLGVPISFENVDLIEKTIESCVKLQPYVVDVKVEVDRKTLEEKLSRLGYTTLSPEMLKVEVVVEVENVKVRGTLKWVEEMKYPYMDFEVISF
ncbi:dihydroneopterin aldolase family protein [Archaeoglobus sp.]